MSIDHARACRKGKYLYLQYTIFDPPNLAKTLPHQLRWLAVLDSKRKEFLFLFESALQFKKSPLQN